MFSVKETARMLGVPLGTVYYRAGNRLDLVPIRVGGRIFFTADSVFQAIRRKAFKTPFNRKKREKTKRGKRKLKAGQEWRLLARKKRSAQKKKASKVYRDALRETDRIQRVQEAHKRAKREKRLLRRGEAK